MSEIAKYFDLKDFDKDNDSGYVINNNIFCKPLFTNSKIVVYRLEIPRETSFGPILSGNAHIIMRVLDVSEQVIAMARVDQELVKIKIGK